MEMTSEKCKKCEGRGFLLLPMETGKMLSQRVEDCEECKGTGKIYKTPGYGSDGGWVYPGA